MHGYIVTTHYNNYNLIKKCLDLIFENCICDSIVTLFVNETTDSKVLNIKNEYFCDKKDKTDIIKIDEKDINNKIINTLNITFKTFYISDQLKNNGLTGTWNQGIEYIINNFPSTKIITILGHDTFLNSSFTQILKRAEKAYNKNKLEYYGPLYKFWNGKNDELWQDEKHYKKNEFKFLIGSLLCIPINCIKLNKISDKEYFNNKYPFGYNDIDWYNRFIKLGGNAIIVTDCIIEHKYNRSWISVDPRLNNKYIDSDNLSIVQVFDKFDNIKNFETDFNWLEYSMANRDLKIKSEIEAINHYMTIGKMQKRPLRISY